MFGFIIVGVLLHLMCASVYPEVIIVLALKQVFSHKIECLIHFFHSDKFKVFLFNSALSFLFFFHVLIIVIHSTTWTPNKLIKDYWEKVSKFQFKFQIIGTSSWKVFRLINWIRIRLNNSRLICWENWISNFGFPKNMSKNSFENLIKSVE
jgi:hypothetical protein